ncbi:RTA-like protein [Penicillium digitatum]|uniref:RTA-like protein n=1 Tax=Penicillium digitatum TaxID=36651 RepID=A0A7T6XMB6_PENDI|nr:RTA-like protein [Penicillium digitatum]
MSSHPGWTAYEYYPSIGTAVVFIISFAIVTLMHTFHMFRTRTWFVIPLMIGGYSIYHLIPRSKQNPDFSRTNSPLKNSVELVGYIGRVMSSKESPNWTIGPYVMQSTLLLIAPLFAASIHMELSRIIVIVKGEQFALIRVDWMTKILVTGDVLSFLMQASGAGIMGIGSSSTDPSSSISMSSSAASSCKSCSSASS